MSVSMDLFNKVVDKLDRGQKEEASKYFYEFVALLDTTEVDYLYNDIVNDTLLIAAANRGFNDSVKVLIEKGATINWVNKHNGTALYYAVKCGHYDSVKLLLDNGADANIQEKINTGNTPLHEAIYLLDEGKMLKLLIDNGVQYNSLKNKKGQTPFDMALYSTNEKKIEMIKSIQ